MGRLTRRLRYLEERARPWGTRETLILDRALARLTPDDISLLSEYLDREAEPTEDEAEVLSRLEEHLNAPNE